VKVLVVHNRYQHAGGEDEVFAAECRLLRDNGHDVHEYVRTNEEIVAVGPAARIRLAAGTVWARTEQRSLRDVIGRVAPDVAHFHNTFPLISPAAYYTCREAGVPVVQTLHNYRLLCPTAIHYRAGGVCEDCTTGGLQHAVRHACYRGSRGATGAVTAMLAFHRAIGTWTRAVDVYVALSEFARSRFIDGGLPADRIVVKPNFVDTDPGPRDVPGNGALFVGRFWPEKGIRTLVQAWNRLTHPIALDLFGDGPEREGLMQLASSNNNVRFHGRVPRAATLTAMKRAGFLVFPSEWFEGLPMTIVEAFACGLPVIASRLGTMADVVADGRTGLLFTPGDADDLARKVEWARTHPAEMAEMGRAARREFEAVYTAPRNLELLLDVYRRAIAATEARCPAGDPAGVVMDQAAAPISRRSVESPR
jgi:glycosyltransferase involved in cell wall biosynthesis